VPQAVLRPDAQIVGEGDLVPMRSGAILKEGVVRRICALGLIGMTEVCFPRIRLRAAVALPLLQHFQSYLLFCVASGPDCYLYEETII
jgi:hypothetical protein